MLVGQKEGKSCGPWRNAVPDTGPELVPDENICEKPTKRRRYDLTAEGNTECNTPIF